MSNALQNSQNFQQQRLPISLQQIESIPGLLLQNQPLSPTHTTISQSTTTIFDNQKSEKQTALKGQPNYVGLTTIEYIIDDKLSFINNDLDKKDLTKNYYDKIYEDHKIERIQQALKTQKNQLCKLEVWISLPFDMLIQQVELQIKNIELFQKYMTLIKIDKSEDEEQGMLLLKSGFIDQQKRVIQLNTCGVTSQIKLCFMFDKSQFAMKDQTLSVSFDSQGNNAAFKNQLISEKIQNEILPLLNGSDDDLDELDDEVAMISNKKGVNVIKNKDDNKNSEKEEQKKKGSIDIQGRLNKMTNKVIDEQRNYNQNINFSDSQINQESGFPQHQEILNSQQESLAQLEFRLFEQFHKNPDTWYVNFLSATLQNVKLVGFNCNQIPAITNMSVLMNESFYLKKEKYLGDAQEVDFLVGILLISTKRYTQAAEILRKIQAQYLKHIDGISKDVHLAGGTSPKTLQSTNKTTQPNTTAKQDKFEDSKKGINLQNLKTEQNKLFIKSAIIELLITESMCQNTQINEKMQSIKRMIDLFVGKLIDPLMFQHQIFISEDPYTIMLKILPFLLKFVLMCMTHKRECVKLAAIKLLEFILETKGCSLDQSMVFILKIILKTYPGQAQGNLNNKSSVQNQGLLFQDSFNLSMIQNNENLLTSPRHSKNQASNINEMGTAVKQNIFLHKGNNKSQTKINNNDNFIQQPNDYISLKEPNSGFNQALKNAYNHVLETYISVLSSISSHILHQLFYEVIIPCLTGQSQVQISNQIITLGVQPQLQILNEIKVYSIKIADKIITICQGDLMFQKFALDQIIFQVTSKTTNNDQNFTNAMKNLWQSIRTKVFTNYSLKGMKILIDWLVEKLSILAQQSQSQIPIETNQKSSSNYGINQDIAKIELNEEEMSQLVQIVDVVSIIAIGRKKNEEEANNLIKIKQDYCIELYLLINPLLFWLDFSVEREERLSLFKQLYQAIKDVLENLPPKKVDLDLLQIMVPILQRTTEYLKNNSPSLSMLKFLDLVLRDMKSLLIPQVQANIPVQPLPTDLQFFFMDLYLAFVPHISGCVYDEAAFNVFAIILSLCQDVLTKQGIEITLEAILDKNTIRGKGQKMATNLIMKAIIDPKYNNIKSKNQKKAVKKKQQQNNNLELSDIEIEDESIINKSNYFEIFCDFSIFNNKDPSKAENNLIQQIKGAKKVINLQDQHDLYIEKLQMFIESLNMIGEVHISMFLNLILKPKFKDILLQLLQSGETPIRLKSHEILEGVTNFYHQYLISKTVVELNMTQNNSSLIDGLGQRKKNGGNNHNEVMETDFISKERLQVSQMVVQCIKASLEQKYDSYLQFNALIQLDFLFQNLLPVPSYQNEYLKGKGLIHNANQNDKNNQSILNIMTMLMNESSPEFEVTESRYQLMRLNLVFNLWPFIQQALNSAWSNIRSICYGLICSMLKIDIRDYSTTVGASNYTVEGNNGTTSQINIMSKLKQIILPMLLNLLSSKESESKAGGLNILGSFCGLSYDFSKVKISKNLDFFKKNSNFISLTIWQLVFDLQDDWDITIKEASVVLIQLCAPRKAVTYFDKVKREKEQIKFASIINKYGVGVTGSQGSSRNQMYLNSGTSNDENDMAQYLMQNINNSQKNLLTYLSGQDEYGQDQLNLMQYDYFEQTNHQKVNQQNRLNAIRPSQSSIAISDQNEQISNGKEDSKRNSNIEQDLERAIQFQDIHGDIDEDLDNIDNLEMFQFFVDEYSDDQIQEIISIFRNDFKPPKNLWIEKNQSSAFNSPDYYSEIYSQAIDQFNQQQLQLQQQQQQQLQLQVSSSSNKNSLSLNIVDALEDDLVKRYDIEKKEKEKSQSEVKDNYMIFERHFEDGKEDTIQQQSKDNQNNIDAEPYKFLNESSPTDSDGSIGHVNNNVTVFDEVIPIESQKVTLKETIQQPKINDQNNQVQQKQAVDKALDGSKKTTDELIEEYERKINKTIKLLEEEKKKNNTKKGGQTEENQQKGVTLESNTKSTPEFKQKSDKIQENTNFTNINKDLGKAGQSASTNQKIKNSQNLIGPQILQNSQNIHNEPQRGYLSSIDNIKLMKQINNCFNDNQLNTSSLAAAFSQQSSSNSVVTKKPKLNKSFENSAAAHKQKSNLKGIIEGKGSLLQVQNKTGIFKKNLSTSPKRGSSSGKKSGSKVSVNKKKFLDSNRNNTNIQGPLTNGFSKNTTTTIYNMRDLNFFIKTIEKDLSDKFTSTNKLNMKDFNSMPTTPTSILKKVEDQVKAIAMKKDQKGYMNNTCPNIAQVLGSLDTAQTSKSNQQLLIANNNQSQQVSGGNNEFLGLSQNHTPSHINTNNLAYAGSGGINQLEKFTFSKTQKIDFKDNKQNIFGYGANKIRDEQYQREMSSDNIMGAINNKVSPKMEDKYLYANLLQSKQMKNNSSKNSKRSRGSQDKYGTSQVNNSQASGFSSQSKLNKSANMIQQVTNKGVSGQKESLSKSFANTKGQLNLNISPNSKKPVQQNLIQQLGLNSKTSTLNQTPLVNNKQPLQLTSTAHSNLMFDYIQNSDQIQKKINIGNNPLIQNKTPMKSITKPKGSKYMTNYSEILEISPSSGDKDMRIL